MDFSSVGLGDLLTSSRYDDVIDWGEARSGRLGAGTYANAYDVPGRPDLAIRVGGGIDSFLEYAIRIATNGQEVGAAAGALPVVYDIAFLPDGCLYLVERLQPLSEADREIITDIFCNRRPPPTPAWQDAINRLDQVALWLDHGAVEPGQTVLDWRLGNIMRRGDTLVFTDPLGGVVGAKLTALMSKAKRFRVPFPSLLDSYHRFRRPVAAPVQTVETEAPAP